VCACASSDFDVHHGNGTEEILASDSRFFFVSTHTFDPTTAEDRFYPGTGSGSGDAEEYRRKNVVNVALSRGFVFTDWLAGWREESVRPFRPPPAPPAPPRPLPPTRVSRPARSHATAGGCKARQLPAGTHHPLGGL
jgi:hypothetical protein